MNVTKTRIPEVLLLEPRVFRDSRGYFYESWSQTRYAEAGITTPFVQDNVSRSGRDTLRGLHLQNPHGQGKLVQAVLGEVFDVAVDVRVGSPTFGQWVGEVLSDENNRQLYIPPGFAHGFCVRSETAIFSYKCTGFYHAESELGVLWNDRDLAIQWDVDEPSLSVKDAAYPRLADIDTAVLPRYVPER